MRHTVAGARALDLIRDVIYREGLEVLVGGGTERLLFPGTFHDFVDYYEFLGHPFFPAEDLDLKGKPWAIEDQDSVVVLREKKGALEALQVTRHTPEDAKILGRAFGACESYDAGVSIFSLRFNFAELCQAPRYDLVPEPDGRPVGFWIPSWSMEPRALSIDMQGVVGNLDKILENLIQAIVTAVEELRWFNLFGEQFKVLKQGDYSVHSLQQVRGGAA